VNADPEYGRRYGHSLVSLHDRLYVIGGKREAEGEGEVLGDVWESTDDGTSWTQLPQHESYRYSARWGHCAVVHNGNILVVGGNASPAASSANLPLNDVYASADAANWVLYAESSIFAKR